MTLLDWSDELEIGVEAVDKEHRELIDAINELQVAVEAGEERERTLQLVARVARDAQAHFASEEALMTTAKYPGTMLHKMKHEHMIEQIRAFLARYSRNDSALNRHVLNFLRDSAVIHIRNEDANFGLWMQERGKH